MDFKDAFCHQGAHRLEQLLLSIGVGGTACPPEPGISKTVNPGSSRTSSPPGASGESSEVREVSRLGNPEAGASDPASPGEAGAGEYTVVQPGEAGAGSRAGESGGLAQELIRGFGSRELMDRSRLVTRTLLDRVLSRRPDRAAEQIFHICEGWAAPGQGFQGMEFWFMAFLDCIPELFREDPGVGLEHLRELTGYFSAEFAVRPLILADPAGAVERMTTWTGDSRASVRRLASEGLRPRLPWGIRLNPFIENPSPLIALLRGLRCDPDEAVRRSVANNLNDISKDHPEFCLQVLDAWTREFSPRGWQGLGDEDRRFIQHAGRTLVKKGHPGMLELMGFGVLRGVRVHAGAAEPNPVPWQGRVKVSWGLRVGDDAPEEQRVAADFVMHRMTASGRWSAKVWKGQVLTLIRGQEIEVGKEFSFAPVTTRRYYPGTHQIELQLNGQVYPGPEFELSAPGAE
ncbi:hypothetical protein [Spirochaeta lutea]|uniref:hypothetical protein n=1 Tax=Spirochaeta lutea TaxID=1480694 RepID=UPI000690A385|nr:hypothetical protein [Spirochaeta lutea]